MTKPTREQKRERIKYHITSYRDRTTFETPDIDAAILADYAPLTALQREELDFRRGILRGLGPIPGIKRWLAEIDAELEET